jgi:hypothetical protein
MDECTNKMRDMHAMQYYLALKGISNTHYNMIKHEDIMLIMLISQKWKDRCCMIPFI